MNYRLVIINIYIFSLLDKVHESTTKQSHLFLSHSYCRFCEKMSSLKSGEELKRRVLSIQSHVIHGYVGNKSATFPLQVSGYDKFNFEMQ